jgi:chromosome segregation protein
MRIKRLEIHGFKSFGDRVELTFGDGISGVVGPNGCGKSNIVDAIRWCMGEMSAKHLRGRAMQDVIFAGSESRGPMGMAEVTLVMHNDGNAPPQYAAFSEIAVTRRLHRDGTSEYLVNKTPARLRDITDLFLGTGVGTRAYSIIEQGRIGFIVSARPEDRRSLIEEVAGITRFKARKKSAERRMHATEQNLQRVGDIVSELERQLGSLRRQARKAERYRELKEEQRDLELHAATMEMLRLRAVEQVQQGERTKLERKVEDAQGGLAAEEAGLEGDRLRLLEQERRLQDEQQTNAEADAELAALERDLEHWKRQLAEATERARTTAADVSDAKERIQAARTERLDLESQAQRLASGADADDARVGTLKAAVSELQGGLAELDEQIESLRRGAVEHVHGAARHRTHAAALDRQRTDVRGRLGQAVGERDDLIRRKTAGEEKIAQLEERRQEATHQHDLWNERLEGMHEQLERVVADVNRSEARVMALRGEILERRSRLESLEEIARKLEGYSDGVRTLLGVEGDDASLPAGVDGIHGLVTDIIEAKPEHERAIEAVLGEKIQYLIVESEKAGTRAIEVLKERAGGRGGFIPLSPRTKPPGEMPAAQEGLVGAALDCVSVEPRYAGVAEYLLGDVVIVEGLAAALDVWSKNGHAKTLVTLDGEVLDPAGVLAGGSDDGAGLLAKRREIRELTEMVHELEAKLAMAQGEHDTLEQTRLQLEVNVQQLEKDIRTVEVERVELSKDIEAVQGESRMLGERIEVLDYEITQRNDELQGIEEDEKTTVSAALESEREQKAYESRIDAVQGTRRARAEELESRSRDLTDLRVNVAARDEKLESIRLSVERLTHTEADLLARVTKGVGSINEDKSLVGQLEEKISESGARALQMADVARRRHATLDEARGVYETDRARMGDFEQGLREKRHALELAKEALVNVKMDLQRLEMDRQRLFEQIAERHDVDLLRTVGDYHLRDAPGPEARERLKELDRAIKNIGPINLTAIDECAEIEGRHAFLVEQRDDLQEALDALKRAIQRINRTSRDRFTQAFEAVNEMFQKVFPRLFRGGEARLQLTNPEDMLEAGVEIVAQPPGKKLQNVNLLSGGEKALTATALVFAIFLVKPSPFCVLDEVDAPLDDANVGRFNELLRDISKISQFIVITHNKLTMTEAVRLYGITMEEPGLSKLVSVDMEGRVENAA